MIYILDYGAGNLMNIYNAFKKIRADIKVVNNLKEINKAEGLVIPGVGAFDPAMKRIGNFTEVIKKLNIPVLGICLGIQLFATESEESKGKTKGFNIIKGKVVKFKTNLKVPHMGWNQIKIIKNIPLLEGIKDGDYFYFVHSYYIVPKDKDDVIATTEYGYKFASIAANKNFYGIQFHPERSGKKGLQILKNFTKMTKC